MIIKNNINTYITSQPSATISYLVWGIIGIFLAVALEFAVVWNFFKSPINEAIGVAVIMQLALVFTFILIRMLFAYRRKTNFMMYFAYIEDANMKSVKEKYHVCFVDETGVLFIDKDAKTRLAYNDWTMLHKVDNLSTIKECLFPEPSTEFAT